MIVMEIDGVKKYYRHLTAYSAELTKKEWALYKKAGFELINEGPMTNTVEAAKTAKEIENKTDKNETIPEVDEELKSINEEIKDEIRTTVPIKNENIIEEPKDDVNKEPGTDNGENEVGENAGSSKDAQPQAKTEPQRPSANKAKRSRRITKNK